MFNKTENQIKSNYFLNRKKVYWIIGIVAVLLVLLIAGAAVAAALLRPKKLADVKQDYYQELRNKCHNNGCCLTSVKAMSDGNYKLEPEGGCPERFARNMLKCAESYKWCEPAKIDVPDVTEKISVTTDKLEYQQGETVKFVIKNDSLTSEQKIYFPEPNIERYEDGNWKPVKTLACPCNAPYCYDDENKRVTTVKAKDRKEYQWNQAESYCSDNLAWYNRREISKQVESGRYRFRIKQMDYGFVLSNEFIIKVNSGAATPSDIYQIYRNNEYGFEVMFPSGWSEREKYHDTDVMLLNTSKEIVEAGKRPDDYWQPDGTKNSKYVDNWVGIGFNIYPKPTDFNWKKWMDNFPSVESYEDFSTPLNSGLKGIKVVKLRSNFFGNPNVFIEGEDIIYNLRFFSAFPFDIQEDGLSYFEQMLKSLKFIKSDTYRNEQHGFEFKLPGYYSEEKLDFENMGDKEYTAIGLSYLSETERADFKNHHIAMIMEGGSFSGTFYIKHYNKKELEKMISKNISQLPVFVNENRVKYYIYERYFIVNDQAADENFIVFETWPEKERADKFNREIFSTFSFVQKKDISGWQTYKNEDYGFEFKYPDKWRTNIQSFKGGYYFITIKELDSKTTDFEQQPISISFNISPYNSDFARKLNNNININGVQANKNKVDSEAGSKITIDLPVPQKFVIDISGFYPYSKEQYFSSVFDLIMNTIKF